MGGGLLVVIVVRAKMKWETAKATRYYCANTTLKLKEVTLKGFRKGIGVGVGVRVGVKGYSTGGSSPKSKKEREIAIQTSQICKKLLWIASTRCN